MFRVDQRFIGQGLWNSAAMPMTLQAAYGRLLAMQNSRFADDARIVAAASSHAIAPRTEVGAEGQIVDKRV